MVDNNDDFDESLLDQPWDPVSYFDEEEGTEEKKGENEIGTSPGRRLSDLFETNLRSVENDIKRMAIRKQSEDHQDSLLEGKFNSLAEKGNNEEFDDAIERFITYEDKEDNLKSVESTVLINQKSIDNDMKRLAHFRQQSLQQDDVDKYMNENRYEDALSQESGCSNEEPNSIDDLVMMLPDAVQNDPIDSNAYLDDKTVSGIDVNAMFIDGASLHNDAAKDEIDIEALLPNAINEEPKDFGGDQLSKTENDSSNKNENQLIDFDQNIIPRESNFNNFADSFRIGNLNVTGSASASSHGSIDSVNGVIEAAEAVELDFATRKNTITSLEEKVTTSGTVDSNAIIGNTNEHSDHQGLLIDLDEPIIQDVSSTTKPHDPDIIQFRKQDMVPIELLEGSDFENNVTKLANTSVSSLHDELVSASPGFDFQEPNFDKDEPFGATAAISAASLSLETRPRDDVKAKMSSAGPAKRKHRRSKKSNRPKYLVDIVKSNEGEFSNTDSESESFSEASEANTPREASQSEAPQSDVQSLDNNIAVNDETAVLVKATEPAAVIQEQNLVKQEANLLSEADQVVQDQAVQRNENTQEIVNSNDPVVVSTITEESESNEIYNITRQISEQLADEILNEEEINIIEPLHNSEAVNDSVFPEDGAVVTAAGSANADVGTNGETEEPVNDAVPRRGTRTGSTSDSEELEEFINQQLNADVLPSPPEMSATGGLGNLPPISEEIQLGWYAPEWVPDKDAKACMNCGLKFTVVKRRHHCRACGKVLCSYCCNMKADLAYLGYKPSRVCQACFEILISSQSISPLPLMSGSQDVPGRGHTISLNESEPSCSLVSDSPPQYMPDSPPEYSVVPGATVQSGPPNPPSYFASSGRGSGFRTRTESDRSVVIMFNSSQTDLPPILKTENEVVKIINNPNLKSLFQQLKDPAADPVAFLVNKNLVVKLKVVSLDCCVSKECWCFSSDGMGASNQEEIVFLVVNTGDDPRLLKCVFQQFNSIFERAKHGEPMSDLSYVSFDEYMLNNRKNIGMLLFKPNVQCVKNILVPGHPYLFGLWIQQTEIPWAKNLPLRLLFRLGAEFKSYPFPVFNLADREPVFHIVGRTIIGLLADFRSFQYTLPRISGLLLTLTAKDVTIKLPQTRYDEVLKVLNTTEESVMAFAGNFSRKADGHLVSNENDGTHTTQTIVCRTTGKNVSGCTFVVLSAALKGSNPSLQAKTSVVEDGIMIQVTPDTMKKIRSAMKEMKDLTIPAGEDPTEGETNESKKLKIIWGSSDDSANRISSPIDGSSFDGLTNMRIRHSYDYTVSTSPAKIHWQEVYFLPNDADTVGRLSAKELSQMTSSVAKACMNALAPHLSTLVALEMTKIGLRMILDSDVVEYRIGSNKEQLPQELTGDLDDKLIPVIHAVMKTVSHRRVSAELIFQITRIV